MKQSVLFIVILFATSSCLKEDKRSNDPRFISVEEYIVLLKSGNFDIWMIPIFEISDIPALLKHARNEQTQLVDLLLFVFFSLYTTSLKFELALEFIRPSPAKELRSAL